MTENNAKRLIILVYTMTRFVNQAKEIIYPWNTLFWYAKGMIYHQNLEQAGAELGKAQHSWDWAWLIKAKASVVVGSIVNEAKCDLVSKCGAKFFPQVMLEF